MGPMRETHRGVSSLGETGELWALAHHQLFSKGFQWSYPAVCPDMAQAPESRKEEMKVHWLEQKTRRRPREGFAGLCPCPVRWFPYSAVLLCARENPALSLRLLPSQQPRLCHLPQNALCPLSSG